MKQFKIIPLLLFVIMIAFSVRLVDVISGVSSLSGSAHAESKKEMPKESVPKKKTDEEHMEKEMADSEDEAVHGDDGESEKTIWRDSGDEDPGYISIKQELFDELSARRKELDAREKNVRSREALLSATEQELDRKVQELSQLRQEIEGLLEQQSAEEKARIQSLVKIYEGMKPKDAARIFDTLDLDILVSVVGLMSERKISPVLAAMNPERARTITIMLAQKKQLPELRQSNL